MNKIIILLGLGLSMTQAAQAELNLDVSVPVNMVKYDIPAHRHMSGKDVVSQASQAYVRQNYRKALSELRKAEQTVNDYSLDNAKILLFKAENFEKLGQTSSELDSLNEMIALFGMRDEDVFQNLVVYAYLKKGHNLQRQMQFDEALHIYNQILDRFEMSQERKFHLAAATAQLHKAKILKMLGQPQNALAVYDQLIEKFIDFNELKVQQCVADGLAQKMIVLAELDRMEEHALTMTRLLERFKDHSSWIIQQSVAEAIVSQGNWLESQQQLVEAQQQYDEWLERMKDDTEITPIRQKMSLMTHLKGRIMLRQAKANWADQDTAQVQLKQALTLNQEALTHISDDHKILVLIDMAYISWLMNQPVQAHVYLKQSIEQDAEHAYQSLQERYHQQGVMPDLEFHSWIQPYLQSFSTTN